MIKKKIVAVMFVFVGMLTCFKSSAASIKLEIFLDPDGGSCNSKSIVYQYDDEQTPAIGKLPDCEKADYSFLGWKDESGSIITDNTLISDIEGTKLKAYYTITKKTLSFQPAGGTVAVSSKEVNYNEMVGDLPVPVREGYAFLGWYTQEQGGILFYPETIYGYRTNITLFAHWTIIDNNTEEVKTGEKDKTEDRPKGMIKLSWTKIKGADGYQIQYSKYKNLKNKKIIKVKGGKKTSYKIKKLEKGIKYYIRIRAYKNGKKKIYSKWSQKIKKIAS